MLLRAPLARQSPPGSSAARAVPVRCCAEGLDGPCDQRLVDDALTSIPYQGPSLQVSGHRGRASPCGRPDAYAARSHHRRSHRPCHYRQGDLNPRTGQRSERSYAYLRWFAGNLLATERCKGAQQPVCAGGRDRFRTCGLCRVKRVRPPYTALWRHASHHIIPARQECGAKVTSC